MGYWKEKWMDEYERVYSAPDGRFVCPACITDRHLAAAVEAHVDDRPCSYCGRKPAAELSVLMDEIVVALGADYTDPVHELPYESREGGYQGVVRDGSDLVDDLEPWTENDDLLADASRAFATTAWCERDYFALKPYQSLSFGWKGFSEQVKHRTRFLFLQELKGDGDPNDIPPGRMLDALGRLFVEFSLLADIPAGTEFVRARIVATGERPSSAADLGTAPVDRAVRPNRMSPAGIPMFYGAVDENTAVLETYQPERGGDHEIALARFRTVRSLKILDLKTLPRIPSVFDSENREKRQPLSFLRDFEREFTRPVARDDKAHVEYVPTQVVTEFVRHRLLTPDSVKLDGIRYRSSHAKASTAIVLFADPEHCGPRPNRSPLDPVPFLELIDVRYAPPDQFADLWRASK